MRITNKYLPSPVCPRCEVSMRLDRLNFRRSTMASYECDLCNVAVIERPEPAEILEATA